MSTDFWAGYISGAVGIIVGNPLDIVKTRMQADSSNHMRVVTKNAASFAGVAAPVLGYGALNAILFASYNRTENLLNRYTSSQRSLWVAWIAGATGGLATWAVSAPTELIKCRAQLGPNRSETSWSIATKIWKTHGVRGFYLGGVVTALRDSVGYGFYFWSYQLTTQAWQTATNQTETKKKDTLGILICGGLAGIATWVSIFPLDVVKTRVQTQASKQIPDNWRATRVAKDVIRNEGFRVFFRGLTVCSIRAFVVNAVQWATYEWVMDYAGDNANNINTIDIDRMT